MSDEGSICLFSPATVFVLCREPTWVALEFVKELLHVERSVCRINIVGAFLLHCRVSGGF